MNQLFKVYLKQYYHLAVCTFCITAFTYKSAAVPVHWYYSLWIGIITFILYNYRYLLTFDVNQLYVRCKRNAILPIIVFVVLCFGFFQTKNLIVEIPAWILAFLLSLFYFRKSIFNSKALRENYLLKPLIIGLVFAILTAYIPYLHAGYSISESILLSVSRVTFIAALALVFDIGDIQDDTESPTVTFPQRTSVLATKWVASILLLISGLIEAYGSWIFLIEFPALIALFFTYVFTWVLILKSGTTRPYWYYLFMVDGTMVMPLLFSLI